MYLLYRPFLKQDTQVKGRPLFIYQLVIFVFYLISVLFTQMFFALDEIKLIPEPIMYILKSQEVTFVKRLDIFFVYIWLSWSIVTVMIFGLSFRVLYLSKKEASAMEYYYLPSFTGNTTALYDAISAH